MKSFQNKNTAPANTAHYPFFQKENNTNFFGNTSHFFTAVQKKCTSGVQEQNIIQRQEKPDEPVTKETSPGTAPLPTPVRTPRAARCVTNPAFPDFGCFAGQLKLDVDENLQNNAYQFYQAANLHPGDNELMWNTFLRYGIGRNLLQTSFGFMGANKKWGNMLSYGAGIGMKSYQFLKDGELKLDIQIPVGKGVNLDIKFDYNTNPDKPADEKVNTSIGISGRF
ncbi:hypothetical protein [Agriterribacter sp.]|uniref:hypothetical protein n=1 Tax=Agriterribacter sp. TaxID=2821509 RepID=UPI002CA3EAF6|nr:hypothetical protein [Agriterribacter sp.]HTN06763.1 hypothetical protein [Agriterribacter sp.]